METISEISKIHSYDESRISFYNLDRQLLQIDFTKISSLDDLIDCIKNAVTVDDENKNIYLARSIVYLMYILQGDGYVDVLPVDVAFLILFQDDVVTFSDMCRLLDIPCEIIHGEMKDFTTYRHETYTQKWCAFMSNDRWHLVDLLGILTCTSYRETEGRIVLESEGEAVFDKPKENAGVTSINFNDFWFCTNPKIFMCYNFPNDTEWLLLDESKGPHTIEQFNLMPFTYLEYHSMDLKFLSESSSLLYSQNGRCTISLRAHPNILRSKCFSYILSFVEGTGDISGIEKDDLPLLVRYAPGIDTISFNIRCPVSGRYVFEVEAKDLDNVWNSNQCFDVIIECEEADPNCRKLPIDAGIVGFGYGHAAKEAGLKNPSKTNPSVNVNVEADDAQVPSVLTFQIEDDQIDAYNYGSKLVGADNGEGFTETHVDAVKGKLTVVAGVKTEGEYALSITARPRESYDSPETVLNYLLTTSKNDDDEKQEKLMKKRKFDLILESKMEERITKKAVLTKELDFIEQELKELRKLVQTEVDEIKDEASFEDTMPECSDNSMWMSEKIGKRDNAGIETDEDDTNRSTTEAVSNTDDVNTNDMSSLKVSDGDVGGKPELNKETSKMKNETATNAFENDNKDGFTVRKHLSPALTEDKNKEKKSKNTTKTKMCRLM